MLAPGESIPAAGVWLGPREPASLSALAEGPILLLFYLFDWSAT